jgi:dihydroorotase
MFDCILRGGRIVEADGIAERDLAIAGGRVAALLAPGMHDVPARRVVDVAGLLLLPGLVDAHVHLREPGYVQNEGFANGTRAALAGGVTTVMVMPTDDPATLTAAQFAEKRALAEGSIHVDLALQALAAPGNIGEFRALRDAGAISFELFMGDAPPAWLSQDAESLLAVLRGVAEIGAIAGITANDHELVLARTAAAQARTDLGAAAYPLARPVVSEALAIARACIAAREAGCAIHLRQLSSAEGLRVFRALTAGQDASAEATPHNLLLDESELARQGPYAKVGPPLRPRADVLALQQALGAGLIEMVATDHAPHLPAEKERGRASIWDAPSGLPGLETFLPAMLALVERGVIDMPGLVRLAATEPARRFGLHSRKGTLRPGADADVLLLDPAARTRVRSADMITRAGHTPFDGFDVAGALRGVFLRGAEARVGDPPRGAFLRP